ncbi:UDP-glucose 4-epimerase GalE [Halomonas sp. G11]|uniref:UDP-glucose 4-epimerase GalE n=1 Tax=Halomonas sp. G11 TaxID=1684425 RepID=UPI0009ED2C49|nr:UDP-glucose 4-epimerase GalE [Halomonas sp. G11]
MNVLVTGGAGYIGSHALVALIEANYDVVVLDNLINGSAEAVMRVEKITQRKIPFYEGDIRDSNFLNSIFKNHDIDVVVHFAGLKSVGNSVKNPIEYFDFNVNGTISLVKGMELAGIYRLVFSSSATVYGDSSIMPLHEDLPTGEPKNPYGRSKLIIEQMLQDLAKSNSRWSIGLLRYFNPVGAHESGLIGESPQGTPNNLLPYVAQVAVRRLPKLAIFGNDYDTIDGTGIRDYIHVMDLVEGHVKAIKKLEKSGGLKIWNLGTGKGYSVLEMVDAFESVSGRNIPYYFQHRREGDVAVCWADVSLAEIELGWRAKRDLLDMVGDTWRWQIQNPEGYR